MITINPYLNFDGNTEEAFNFYKSVFGGEFSTLQRFKDMSQEDEILATDREKIMHIALPIGPGNVLMGTDAVESLGQKLTVGDNFSLIISPENEVEADKLFDALSVGGKITMPLEKSLMGAYFGTLTDRFGIQWMVNIPK